MTSKVTPFIKRKTRELEEYAEEVAKQFPADQMEGIYRMTQESTTVFCPGEDCDWKDEKLEYNQVLAYHDEKCPKCGDEVVITDGDLMQYVVMQEVAKTINNKPIPEDTTNLVTKRTTINSQSDIYGIDDIDTDS